MIIISNSERDNIVRYIELMCQHMAGEDTRTYNTKRLARKLAAKLKAKQPLSASELCVKNNHSSKVITK